MVLRDAGAAFLLFSLSSCTSVWNLLQRSLAQCGSSQFTLESPSPSSTIILPLTFPPKPGILQDFMSFRKHSFTRIIVKAFSFKIVAPQGLLELNQYVPNKANKLKVFVYITRPFFSPWKYNFCNGSASVDHPLPKGGGNQTFLAQVLEISAKPHQ